MQINSRRDILRAKQLSNPRTLKYLYFDIFTLFCHLDKSLEVLYHFVNALKNSIFEVNMEYNIEKQHAKGKLHAIERIHALCDKDSFVETYQGVKHNCTSFGMDKKEIP